jgi:hypothetical protein
VEAMTEFIPQASSALAERSHLHAFRTTTDASATTLERPYSTAGVPVETLAQVYWRQLSIRNAAKMRPLVPRSRRVPASNGLRQGRQRQLRFGEPSRALQDCGASLLATKSAGRQQRNHGCG